MFRSGLLVNKKCPSSSGSTAAIKYSDVVRPDDELMARFSFFPDARGLGQVLRPVRAAGGHRRRLLLHL